MRSSKHFNLDLEDDILQGCLITHGGEIVNGNIKNNTPEGTVELVFLSFILVLSIFLGFELIAKVPATLHTPLMSGANAISGITLAVHWSAAGGAAESTLTIWLGSCRQSCLQPSTWSAVTWSPTGCWRCSRSGTRAVSNEY